MVVLTYQHCRAIKVQILYLEALPQRAVVVVVRKAHQPQLVLEALAVVLIMRHQVAQVLVQVYQVKVMQAVKRSLALHRHIPLVEVAVLELLAYPQLLQLLVMVVQVLLLPYQELLQLTLAVVVVVVFLVLAALLVLVALVVAAQVLLELRPMELQILVAAVVEAVMVQIPLV
jgi:hypothetical protein